MCARDEEHGQELGESGIKTLFTPTSPARWVTRGEYALLYVLDFLLLLFLAPIKTFGCLDGKREALGNKQMTRNEGKVASIY
jgi:hypothetical protein